MWCALAPMSGSSAATPRAPRRGAQVDSGFYVGVTSDSTAWLLWIDPSTQRGRVYEPYRPLSLCNVRMDSLVQFSTESADGWRYSFIGQQTHDGFAGRLDRLRATSGRLQDSLAVASRRIPVRLSSALNAVYRDIEATEEHLYGRDLLVLDGVRELVGIVVTYEGAPLNPRLVMVSRRGDSLFVAWNPSQDPDRARIGHDGLLFRRGKEMRRAVELTAVLIDRGTGPSSCR